MAGMKMTEIRGLDDGDLGVQLANAREDLFDMRVKAATESIENPHAIQDLRRSIARMITEQRHREIAGGSDS